MEFNYYPYNQGAGSSLFEDVLMCPSMAVEFSLMTIPDDLFESGSECCHFQYEEPPASPTSTEMATETFNYNQDLPPTKTTQTEPQSPKPSKKPSFPSQTLRKSSDHKKPIFDDNSTVSSDTILPENPANPAGKYSNSIKFYLKANQINSAQKLTKKHTTHLRRKFGIKTHQVKRVAESYFSGSRGAGRPERYVKINSLMKNWCGRFEVREGRVPSIDEICREGFRVKRLGEVEFEGEREWKCSKGWAKRFLLKNGSRVGGEQREEEG
jgi:hypothetical protein